MANIQRRNVVISLIGSRVMMGGIWHNTQFDPGHIQKPDAILKRVLEKADGVSSFLNGQMDQHFKDFVATYEPSNDSSNKLVLHLVELLNKVVNGPSIYDQQRFQGVNLKTDTLELLDKHPQGADLVLLNRRLLENTYYYEVLKGNHWQPNAELCHPSHGMQVDRYEIICESRFVDVADQIVGQIGWVAPSTVVRKNMTPDIKDAWDFEEDWLSLDSWANDYEFNEEKEHYYVHMVKGTFVQQICLFMLARSREIPADLIYNSPPDERNPHGTVSIVDLRLPRYDKITARLNARREDAVFSLKDGIDTKNKAFNELIGQIEHIAVNTTDPILLLGPTGAGKSALAKRIYNLRKQRNLVTQNFVDVNCATIRGEGAMSALFGHEKGAFTGAVSKRKGALLEADKGLLFLDEIGDLGVEEQTMLLKALDNGAFKPLGSDEEMHSDFQLIAASNRDLYAAAQNNQFRADLLARIYLWSFDLPGLRNRPEDIEPNLDRELDIYARKPDKRVRMSRDARAKFLRFATSPEAKWTANFRDLRGMVTRMATFAENGLITPSVLDAQIIDIKEKWSRGEAPSNYDAVLLPILGEAKLANFDVIERIQLAGVVQVCQKSRSAAEAGRKLFSAADHANANHSDLMKKYLEQFDLSFSDCTTTPAS